MTEQAWIALATLLFLIASGLFGWFWSVLLRVAKRLGELSEKIDAKTTTVTDNLKTLLSIEQQRNQDRHVEVIERLTRVETVVLDNGHTKRKRRAA